jgi:acyl-CoA synthetase (AMP-forming)/AMP-acid ligase II/pimeloyl-ACP methyl ester carboxylesterase
VVNSLYPFQSRFFDRPVPTQSVGTRIRLHYLDEGSGPVVVMLHGNPTWSFYYRNLVIALRDKYRCIVPDHIGCGLSDKPSLQQYDYSLKRRIADLEALLDHLNVGECSLVMHDWGGMIGSAWAVRHPERVQSLVVLNTGGFRMPKEKKFPFALWLGRNTWLGTLLIRGLNLFCKRTAGFGVQRKPMSPEVRAEYLRPYDSWRNRIAVSQFVKTIPLKPGDPGYDIVLETENGLAKLRDKPMLLAWGMRDFVFDHHFLTEWQRHFPEAEVMRFDDCGHYILEDAGDEIIPRVREFLAVSRDSEALRSGARSAPTSIVESSSTREPAPRSAAQSLRVAAKQVANVASHLACFSQTEPDRPAAIDPRGSRIQQLTFRQLHEASSKLARGLSAIGISRGVRTVLMVPPSLDFFTLTFALFKVGAVPVLIDPGMGIRNLKRCLAEARPEAFIGIPKAHFARRMLGWGRSSIRSTVTTGWFGGHYSLKQVRNAGGDGDPSVIAPTTADETAAILFTSGSTGVAKGAIYTHGVFASQVEMLRKMYGIEPGEIDLSTFPLFALFGPALGMTAIIPDMNPTRPALVDPRKIVETIERFGVTNLFGSPALINRVGQYGAKRGLRLPTLKRVISAGAPVPARVIERFAAMLEDGAQVHTPYGATEALPVATIGSDELKQTRWATEQGCGICVGRPVEPMQVRIIPIDDGPVAEWDDARCLPSETIGEIAVSGPVVTTAYFGRPEATALATMRDPQTGTIWHRMGDLGYFDSLGRLWFCGRKSQRVVASGGTLFTVPSEAVFNAHPDVSRSALVAVQSGAATHPVLCVESNPSSSRTWAELEKELSSIAASHAHTRSIRVFLLHSGFPVDSRHNAKIFREKLATWAAQRHTQTHIKEIEPVAPAPTFDSICQTNRAAS